ncbi:hypothetical protein K491DRAFT_693081 [Lophiostoma macrostomum CBS 122681]|uniref:Secreted protein n=1 Tax=Lophiostoma macrostomum CBS 122681 TaxID=1314788 RepID=A0A6A6T7A4_9PLEO|nr:hypothetical protein K491DRAFT_693081 [Lophiostoma macrostomum CBS 122681]
MLLFGLFTLCAHVNLWSLLPGMPRLQVGPQRASHLCQPSAAPPQATNISPWETSDSQPAAISHRPSDACFADVGMCKCG